MKLLNLAFRRTPDSVWRYSVLPEAEHHSFPLEWGLNSWLTSNRKGKTNFPVQKWGQHHLTRARKVNVTSGKSCWYQVPPTLRRWEGTSPLPFPWIHNLMRKTSDRPQMRDILQIPGQYSSNTSRAWKTQKSWETVTDQRRLRRQLNAMWFFRWDPGMEKKGHYCKTCEIHVKSGVYLIVTKN